MTPNRARATNRVGLLTTGVLIASLLAAMPTTALAGGTASERAPSREAAADAPDPAPPSVTRHAGPDRYETAAEVSSRAFLGGASLAYVATGRAFPDALAAGSAAGLDGAPILLTAPTSLPAATASELARLDLDEVIVLGGTQAVSDDVLAAIAEASDAQVRRVKGANRYATAAALSADRFVPGGSVAYIATGTNYPDALAGGSLAAGNGAPILLVKRDTVPEETADELQRLQPGRIVVLGGATAVDDSVLTQLETYTVGPVTRLKGSDRYLTSVEISKDGFEEADTVYLATGRSFPDALGGAPAAFLGDGPILLTRPDCVPGEVAAEALRLHPRRIIVLGGRAAVSDRAAAGLACGSDGDVPMPTIVVDDALEGRVATLPPLDDGGEERPVGAIAGDDGSLLEIAEDELVVVSPADRIEDIVDRVGGTILDEALDLDPPVYLVGVDPSGVDPAPLPELMRELDPRARGELRVSSPGVAGLLTLAADAAADGLWVGLNTVPFGADLVDDLVARDIEEGPTATDVPGYDRNPFTWSHLNETSAPSIGVTEAWRALALAGRLPATDGDRIPIGVLDGGFSSMGNFPPGTTGVTDVVNPSTCSGGAACPWHGTAVATTAAGVINDGASVAGVAGPVATLRLASWDGDLFSSLGNLGSALSSRVINMSFSFEVPGGLGFILWPVDGLLELLHASGKMFVASAGNDGDKDVDATDCFVVCWEEAVIAPCELNRVICVGGLAAGSTASDSGSSYGRDSVDIWAPFTVYRGADPDDPDTTVRPVSGTSFSAPYVAGVLALIQAAAPSASIDTVEAHLMATAVPGSGRVTRWVNAYDAVVRALGGNLPPEVAVTSPADGATYRRGERVELSATLTDPDSSGATVTWSLDGTEIGTGTDRSIVVTRDSLALGAHTVRAVFEDGPYSYTVVRTIEVLNTPPTVDITNPAPDHELCQSCSVTLRATSSDPDQSGGALTDLQMVWRPSVTSTSELGRGHELVIQGNDLGPNGTYTVELEATDSQGALATDTVRIQVVSDPSNFDPEATISAPENGTAKAISGTDSNGQYATFDLAGSADDAEDGTLSGTSLSWTAYGDLDGNGTYEEIIHVGSGSSHTDVRLYADCTGTWTDTWRIVLTATDSDGNTGEDEVQVTVTAFC